MNKIWLIIQREFITRVKSKAFLLGTFLAPLAMIAFIAVVAFVMSRGSDEKRTIAVYDQSDILRGAIESSENITLEIDGREFTDMLKDYEEGKIDGIIEMPASINENEKKYDVNYHSDDQLAIDESMIIGRRIEDRIRDYKIKTLDLDMQKVDKLSTDVSLEPKTIKDTDKKISSMTNVVGGVIGGIIGYFMFMIIMVYGGQVMRSVMEEKVNRIIEVLISSVKPYQLMMGKIIGVGSVGLLQITIWMLMLAILGPLVSMVLGIDATSAMPDMSGLPKEAVNESQDMMVQIMQELRNINWGTLVPLSIIYFLGGYFAYASLFAALGSAVGEDVNEAQTLMLPIMMPLFLAIYIAFSAVQAPNTSLVVWSSIIPLLSSIVMPVRLPSSPPAWEIIVSIILLIAFCFFFVWLAGRIYRVGILMYGKKASFRELAKWVFFKG